MSWPRLSANATTAPHRIVVMPSEDDPAKAAFLDQRRAARKAGLYPPVSPSSPPSACKEPSRGSHSAVLDSPASSEERKCEVCGGAIGPERHFGYKTCGEDCQATRLRGEWKARSQRWRDRVKAKKAVAK